MIQLDSKGNIYPYEIIEMELADFEGLCLSNFLYSDSRQALYAAFRKYADLLVEVINGEFYIWIDGSFITNKINPNDIDMVTFIDFEKYRMVEDELFRLKREYKGILDAYYVMSFPKEHRYYSWFEGDKLQWLHTFSRTRNKQPKGIIQLNFYTNGREKC